MLQSISEAVFCLDHTYRTINSLCPDKIERVLRQNGLHTHALKSLIPSGIYDLLVNRPDLAQSNTQLGMQKNYASFTLHDDSSHMHLEACLQTSPSGVLLTLHDATQARLAEIDCHYQNIKQTTQMLTAAIAHDISNPLTFMLNNVEYIRRIWDKKTSPNPDIKGAFDDIVFGLKHIQDLAVCSRSFSLGDIRLIDAQETKHLIKLCISAIRTRCDASVYSTLNVPDDVSICCAACHFYYVVLSLLTNAVQSFSASPLPAAPPLPAALPLSPASPPPTRTISINGQHNPQEHTFVLHIQDNGCGIDPIHKPHIFHPRFTTKDRTQHLGLGLTICQKLIHELGGHIHLDSTPRQGTHISLTLPCVP